MTEEIQTRMADAKEMPKVGEIIGDRYRVDSILGEGGFAVVFKCHDQRTHTDVAVKVLDPMMSSRADFKARFDREVKTVSSLRHHHTIKIFDNGSTERGCAFLVMELLKGSDLDGIIEKGGPMDPARVQRITIQILKSLHEAHSKSIVHRDLKPANVFIADIPGETDYVKVLDFGIAKSQEEGQDKNLTATGQIMCSPDYVAPERVVQSLTFPSSDLYSLGIMMIEMLEGKLPYKGETPIAVALQHARVDSPVPIDPQVEHGPLGPIVRKAVAKDYSERYQSAEDMLADLIAVRFDGVGPYLTELHSAVTPARGNATMVSPAVAGSSQTELMSTFEVPVENAGMSNTVKVSIGAAAVLIVAVVAVLALKKPSAQTDEIPAPPEVVIADVPAEPVAQIPPEVVEEAPVPELTPAEKFRAELPPTLVLQSIPSGAKFSMNGNLLGVSPYTLPTTWIDQVPVVLEVSADGYETAQLVFETPQELSELRSVVLDPISRSSSTRTRREASDSGSSAPSGASGSSSNASSSTSAPSSSSSSSATAASSPSDSGSSAAAEGGSRGRINTVRVRQ